MDLGVIPNVSTRSKNAFFSDWKNPYFLSAMCWVGFLGSDSLGYFMKAPKVAYDSRSPP